MPCSLSKSPLKHGFLDIYLTMFFGAGISRNTSAMRVIFFGKCLKFNIDFKNAKKNSEKFFVFEIIVSELVVLNCLGEAENASHRQSMC